MLTEEHRERAKELLDNPFFDYICEDVFNSIAEEWKNATLAEERHRLWVEQRLIPRIKARLQSAANDTSLRQRALDKLNKRG